MWPWLGSARCTTCVRTEGPACGQWALGAERAARREGSKAAAPAAPHVPRARVCSAERAARRARTNAAWSPERAARRADSAAPWPPLTNVGLGLVCPGSGTVPSTTAAVSSAARYDDNNERVPLPWFRWLPSPRVRPAPRGPAPRTCGEANEVDLAATRYKNERSLQNLPCISQPCNLWYNPCTTLQTCVQPCTTLHNLCTPLYNLAGLTSLQLPPRLTSMGTHTFSDCKGIRDVHLPESLRSIGECGAPPCTTVHRCASRCMSLCIAVRHRASLVSPCASLCIAVPFCVSPCICHHPPARRSRPWLARMHHLVCCFCGGGVVVLWCGGVAVPALTPQTANAGFCGAC